MNVPSPTRPTTLRRSFIRRSAISSYDTVLASSWLKSVATPRHRCRASASLGSSGLYLLSVRLADLIMDKGDELQHS